MTRSRARVTSWIFWLGLVALSLRPVPAFERGLALLLSPLRLGGELATPFGLIRRGEVLAAERQREAEVPAEWEAIRSLARALEAAATPPPELSRGRRPVPAEVVGREPKNRDRVLVRLATAEGVAVGQPVVSGATYVGRVAALGPGHAQATVELITGRDVFVGGRLVQEGGLEVYLTLGGVEERRDSGGARRTVLSIHNPSSRRVSTGRVHVYELMPEVEAYGSLAEGYSLGRVELTPEGRPVLVPDLDYRSGLFHVNVLTPVALRSRPAPELELALEDGAWVEGRRLTYGQPTAGRAGFKVSLGTRDGVRVGAAVVSGTRLVGRVEEAGLWSASVRSLADAGWMLAAVGRASAAAEPLVLGELRTLGWAGGERAEVLLEGWLEARPEDLALELYTGSGLVGLPAGLHLGRATLPQGEAGRVRFALRPAAALDAVRELHVRGTGEALRRGAAGAPGGAP